MHVICMMFIICLSSIELLPKENVRRELPEDYQVMRNIIYGNIPEFEEILTYLEKLQKEVHGLGKNTEKNIVVTKNIQ